MKKTLIALALALIAGQANAAANWVKYSDEPSGTWHIDAASVKTGGSAVAFWIKLNLSAKGRQELPRVSYFVQHITATCGSDAIRVDSEVAYADDGGVASSTDRPKTVTTPPDSIYHGILDAVCESQHIPH